MSVESFLSFVAVEFISVLLYVPGRYFSFILFQTTSIVKISVGRMLFVHTMISTIISFEIFMILFHNQGHRDFRRKIFVFKIGYRNN